jgi:hypothetical protein
MRAKCIGVASYIPHLSCISELIFPCVLQEPPAAHAPAPPVDELSVHTPSAYGAPMHPPSAPRLQPLPLNPAGDEVKHHHAGPAAGLKLLK